MEKDKTKLDPKIFLHRGLVVDASVIAKAFLNEDGCCIVDELMKMNMKGDTSIMAPPVLVSEFLNALSKTFMNLERVETAYKLFSKFNIVITEPDGKFMSDAVKDACENKNVSYYDASYHALAREFGAVFLTADKKYYEAMKGRGNIMLFK